MAHVSNFGDAMIFGFEAREGIESNILLRILLQRINFWILMKRKLIM